MSIYFETKNCLTELSQVKNSSINELISIINQNSLSNFDFMLDLLVTTLQNLTPVKLLTEWRFLRGKTPDDVIDNSKLPFLGFINTTYRQVTTLNGHTLDSAKSALQKYIRRGIPSKAQYISAELDFFRWINASMVGDKMPSGQAAWTNFYHRLQIIILEDIGLGCPQILLDGNKLLQKWRKQKTIEPKELSVELMSLVHYMALTPHTRFYSFVRNYFRANPPLKSQSKPLSHPSLGKDEDLRPIVDEILLGIEQKKISVYYWLEQILNKEKLKEKRPRSQRVGFLIFELIKPFLKGEYEEASWQVCREWYQAHSIKEDFLYVIHPVYVVILRDELAPVWNLKTHSAISSESLIGYRSSLLQQKLKLEGYVYDMHTLKGKQMKRNSVNFAFEGSHVNYEVPITQDYAEMKQLYLATKMKSGEIKSERSEFKLKTRAQLVCSFARPDTYFASDRHENNVVVKGPFLSYKEALISVRLNSVLRLFKGVHTFDINIKYLYPDQFNVDPEHYVGTRLKVEPGKAYFFIVMADLLDSDKYPTKLKSSKIWQNELVFDYERFYNENRSYGIPVPSKMSIKQNFDYLLQLSIRWVLEMGDFAARNFMRVNDFTYNLDLEGFFVGNKIRYKKSEIEVLNRVYKQYRKEYEEILNEWLGFGDGYIDRWYLLKLALKLNDESIERIRNNINKLKVNASKHLLGLE